jgi:hypothetical protein
VRVEQACKRCATRRFGMARPCFGDDPHLIEPRIAPQFDDEVWRQPVAAQNLLFDLVGFSRRSKRTQSGQIFQASGANADPPQQARDQN